MSFKLNPFTTEFDYYQIGFLGVSSSAPSSAQNGNTYINSTDNGYYVYWGSWQLIGTLTPPTGSFLLLEDGTEILLEDSTELVLES